MAEEKEENIVKRVCKELNLTYKQLGERIGYKADTINSVASRGNVSESMQKTIEIYLENLELKEQLKNYTSLKETLKKAILD